MTLGIGAAGVVDLHAAGRPERAPYGDLLMGRPMQPTEFNATLGTQGDLIAADLGQILSISKGGVAQAVSMHVQFLTDQLALRFILRLNAGPWENAPITPYKGTATRRATSSRWTRVRNRPAAGGRDWRLFTRMPGADAQRRLLRVRRRPHPPAQPGGLQQRRHRATG
jgi:hypothetical protein